MHRFRFSIAGLIAMVGIAAAGFAALRIASPGWAGGLDSLSILAMLTSVLGIAFRRGLKRVFWIGFAVFGWTYLVLTSAPWFSSAIGPHLFGAALCRELYPIVHPDSANSGMGGFFGGMGGMGGGFRQISASVPAIVGSGGPPAAPGPRVVQFSDFVRIAQALECLLWAFLGGWTACYLANTRGTPDPGPPPTAGIPAGPAPSA